MRKLILVAFCMSALAFAPALAHSEPAGRTTRATLPEIAMKTLEFHFENDHKGTTLSEFAKRFETSGENKQPAGVFVTISKAGKTRACWGSVAPEFEDLIKATVFTTEAAVTKEYRYPPIKKQELKDLKVQITVVRDIQTIRSFRELNPLRDGVFIRSHARAGVILPGEARDAHYQVIMCKLKAGIPVNSPCQMYRIKADVFR
ncbi:MAG TPA: AMMECR1 domain-containing protein [Candidatus Obscuribacterales bacterium]